MLDVWWGERPQRAVSACQWGGSFCEGEASGRQPELWEQMSPRCPGTVPGLSEASILLAEMCVVIGERKQGWVTEWMVWGG